MNDKSENKNSGRLLGVGISLIFYVFNMVAPFFVADFIEDLIFSLTGDFSNLLTFILTWSIFFIIFMLTFKLVYKITGERTWRTAFIQSGGIFTILHIVFLILKTIAYAIYKSVKESYVIPNFTVEQIEHGRRIYNGVSEFTAIPFFIYLLIVPLPLIIAAVVSWIRLNKNRQETDKIESPLNGTSDTSNL